MLVCNCPLGCAGAETLVLVLVVGSQLSAQGVRSWDCPGRKAGVQEEDRQETHKPEPLQGWAFLMSSSSWCPQSVLVVFLLAF